MSAAQSHFQSSSPSRGFWHYLNRLLIVLIVLTLMATIGYRCLPEVAKRRDQQTRIDQLKSDVDAQRQLLTRNLRTEELLKHDPEYLALIARDRLDLMKEGETIYRLEAPKPDKGRMRLNH